MSFRSWWKEQCQASAEYESDIVTQVRKMKEQPKYEYKTCSWASDFQKHLNKESAEGWRLVSAFPAAPRDNSYSVFFMERKKVE